MHLEDKGIPVIKVGGNLQDHVMLLGTIFGINPNQYFTDASDAMYEYLTKRKGLYTIIAFSFNGFIKSKYAEEERPELQFHYIMLPYKDKILSRHLVKYMVLQMKPLIVCTKLLKINMHCSLHLHH